MNRIRGSWTCRAMARITIAGMLWVSGPAELFAGSVARTEAKPTPSDAKSSSASTPTATKAVKPPAAVKPQPAKLGNRRLPAVTPPPAFPKLSDPPTDHELFKARIFEEPFVPDHAGTPVENQALGNAVAAYIHAKRPEDLSGFEALLSAHPQTAWKVALLTNMSIAARRTGYFTRTLDYANEAWRLGRNSDDPRVRALAERALAELLELSARLGRADEVQQHLEEVKDRSFAGVAGERISQARESLWLMQNRPELAYRCGPLAVGSILAAVRHTNDARVEATESTSRGTSLLQMETLARAVGLEMQMAKREGVEAKILVPSLVHWKAGHFGALVREEAGRYLLQDPTFGNEIWLSAEAVRGEADGYFLVLTPSLPAGWRAVDSDEGSGVWGKGAPPGQNTDDSTPSAPRTGGCPPGQCCDKGPGMAAYWFNEMLASLVISDNPVGYGPPRGPDVRFSLTYNQREAFQPSVFSYVNVGPMWTFNWLGYIADDPSNPTQTVKVYEQGGGQEVYTGYNASNQTYAVHFNSRAVITRVSSSPIRYERLLRDGSVEVYGQPDGAVTSPRKVFLTETRDPQGNSRKYIYDSELRLVAVTDALGQVTTLSYESIDPLKITRVTDPFGRSAQLDYDTAGRLFRITDVIGLVSEVTYTGTQITALKTPYGSTQFVAGQNGADRFIEATDPLGGKERQEFVNGHSPIHPASDPAASVPTGFASLNHHLDTAIGLFWDKKAMSVSPGVPAAAQMTHWAWMPGTSQATAVPRARKNALENRVWYRYNGQTSQYIGTDTRPTVVARVLDDGATQTYAYEYNARGRIIRATDPVGRETVYVYGTASTPDADPPNGTGLDLLQVKQKNGGSYDVLTSYAYNAQHLPLTSSDAAAQSTTYTYNAQGQLLTIVTPQRAGFPGENRTTTLAYDANGYLLSAAGPATGATTSLTYDGAGRVRTMTDSEAYSVALEYDPLDRLTKTTFPDGTYEETVYSRLDAERQRDRLGRWTHTLHNALGSPVAVRDAAGRTTTMDWCSCGSMDRLVDANNNVTRWERDLQGRVLKEVRADNKSREYVYETTTSRLKKIKDAELQETQYGYLLDGRLAQVSYPTAQIDTPTVTFSYDAVYPRLTGMTDGTILAGGTGITGYTYHPIGAAPSLGAGRLATVDGPFENDVAAYAYDERGRVVSRTINNVSSTWSYDALGRLAIQGDPIGTFNYVYVGTTGRLQTLTYPNQQQSSYSYVPNPGDPRLSEIHHKTTASGTTLSRFTYAYDAVGNIKTWAQQYGATAAKAYEFGYDPADQVTVATYRTTDPIPAVVKSYSYGYDPAGNRTTDQVDGNLVTSVYDGMNRLTTQVGGGMLALRGTVGETAGVTVQGKAAIVTADNRFAATTQVTSSGPNTVSIVATDPTGNTRTNTYQISVAGGSASRGYDDNGSLISNGTKTYQWDGQNRLVRVLDNAVEIARFRYDGLGRRAQKVVNGVSRTYIYDSEDIIEERVSTGATIRYVHGQGIDRPLAAINNGTSYYLADHLGSIVQTTNASAQVTLTRQYDPYGTPLAGSMTAGYAYTGREWDPETGLYYYRARYYDPTSGRFASVDPLGSSGARNVYVYVAGNPLKRIDPAGLESMTYPLGNGSTYNLADGTTSQTAPVGLADVAILTLIALPVALPIIPEIAAAMAVEAQIVAATAQVAGAQTLAKATADVPSPGAAPGNLAKMAQQRAIAEAMIRERGGSTGGTTTDPAAMQAAFQAFVKELARRVDECTKK